VDSESALLESNFVLLQDNPNIFSQWKKIVSLLDVKGARVHDARLFAVCGAYRVESILTFNTSDFVRFQSIDQNFKVLDPAVLT
jgi:predicted nucleic acid-binding protein